VWGQVTTMPRSTTTISRATTADGERGTAEPGRGAFAGTYGFCEQCHRSIPEAPPHAALCVTCTAGGLASRR
jgi:RNA polymerase-binding transcription factor DksA